MNPPMKEENAASPETMPLDLGKGCVNKHSCDRNDILGAELPLVNNPLVNAGRLRRVVSTEESPPGRSKNFVSQTLEKSVEASHQVVSPVSSQKEGPSTMRSSCGTALSNLIMNQQYREAIRRVLRFPDEASTWVTQNSIVGSPVKKKGAAKASQLIAPQRSIHSTALGKEEEPLERLPIHMACENLATVSESTLRFQLEQLILRLTLTYPEGVSLVDYDNRLPLHVAIWNNATPETISMLLMADPTSVYPKDPCGRNAAEVNRHRCGVFFDQVKDLLSMGVDFWEDARHKAADRFGNQHFLTETTRLNEQRGLPLHHQRNFSLSSFCVATHEIGDVSAYDSSLTIDLESDSIISESLQSTLEYSENNRQHMSLPKSQSRYHHQQYQQESCTRSGDYKENEQDTRELILQNMLSEMYEKNHRLTSAINELTRIHSTLRIKVDDDHAATSAACLSATEKRILQDIQSSLFFTPVGSRRFSKANNSVSDGEVCELKAQNEALRRKVERLKTKKKKQAEKIDYLKSIVACTESKDLLEDLSDTDSASTISMLGNSVATEVTPCLATTEYTDDDHSSTASSFRRRLASPTATETDETKNREVLITGLAAYRMKVFVSRLQKKVLTFPEKARGDGVNDCDPVGTDNIQDICDIAAEIYSDHVKESTWRNGRLILQWEEPPEPPLPSQSVDTNKQPVRPQDNLPKARRQQDDNTLPNLMPARYAVVNAHTDMNSIVSFSETSLSSIGMHSLAENLWI